MTPQYQDLTSKISYEIKETDRKVAKRYYITAVTLKCMAVCLLLAMGICYLFDMGHRTLICNMTLILAFLYTVYKREYSKKIINLLYDKCDPDSLLSILMAFYSYVRKNSRHWDDYFTNIVAALFFSGRFDDAEKVIPCILRCGQNDEIKMKYEMLCAQQSFVRNDIEELNQHMINLKALGPVTKLKRLVLRSFYQEVMQYQLWIELRDSGRHQELYNIYKDLAAHRDNTVTRVKRNYYLYDTAMRMGDTELAEQHKQYILEKGGTLWYKKVLLS